MILDNDTLLMKCAGWGSYVRNGDPGGCMYGFSPGKGFRSVTHAAMVMHYTDGLLRDIKSHYTRQDIQDLSDILQTALEYLKRRDAAFDAMLAALKYLTRRYIERAKYRGEREDIVHEKCVIDARAAIILAEQGIDTSDIPEASEAFFAGAKPRRPEA